MSEKDGTKRNSTAVWGKLALLLGTPLVFLLLLEGSFRLLGWFGFRSPAVQQVEMEMPTWMDEDDNAAYRSSRRTLTPEMRDFLGLFESGPGFRVRMVPGAELRISNIFSRLTGERRQKYYIHANSLGFRGPELSREDDPKRFRVLVFGDSSCFGWGVNQNETFSALLQQTISAKMPNCRVEVGNFAIPGDSSEYGRLIMEKYLPHYPAQVVILGFGANDAKATYYPHRTQVEHFRERRTLQTLRFWSRKSAAYRTISSWVQKIAKKKQVKLPKSTPGVPLTEYRENLHLMSRMAEKASGARVIILSLCSPESYRQAAAGVAEDDGLEYFDGQNYLKALLPEIMNHHIKPALVEEMEQCYGSDLRRQKGLYLSPDGCHPNKLGHAILAERLDAMINGKERDPLFSN